RETVELPNRFGAARLVRRVRWVQLDLLQLSAKLIDLFRDSSELAIDPPNPNRVGPGVASCLVQPAQLSEASKRARPTLFPALPGRTRWRRPGDWARCDARRSNHEPHAVSHRYHRSLLVWGWM